jgi:ABC-type nickel/cobalt efflux system permease component RcnA
MVILLAIALPLLVPGNHQIETEVHFGLSLGCGLLVVFMALWLLCRRLAGQADHVHLFEPQPAVRPQARVGYLALINLGVVGGLVPCVDALALLTATFVARRLSLGLPIILAFSVGLASVLVLVGVLVVKFKHFASSRWGEGRWVKWLPLASALATLALGLWMCHDAIKQRELSANSSQRAADRKGLECEFLLSAVRCPLSADSSFWKKRCE